MNSVSLDVLLITSELELRERASLFETYMAPVLATMEKAIKDGSFQDNRLFTDFARTSRWAIRRLEYSYVLRAVVGQQRGHLRVLDAGCGVPPFANAVSRLGCDVVGVDANVEVINALGDNDANLVYGTDVEYRLGDIRKMDFPDRSFDVVYSVSVLEHLDGLGATRAIREFVRLLKPGGVIAMTIDYRPFPSSFFRVAQFINDTRLGRAGSRPANRPLDPRTLKSEVGAAILPEFSLDERAVAAVLRITPKEVRKFWKENISQSSPYSGRTDYTSIGVTLSYR